MKTLYARDRSAWRKWLEDNHHGEKQIWLIYYKKHTGKPSIPYEDAVEEAICFGWIDTTIKRLDDERYAQKFTRRKKGSKWNQRNIERAGKMIREGKMTAQGLKKFNERVEYDKVVETLEIPPDMEEALKINKIAWTNFINFAPSYRRMYIYYVTIAKREKTRNRRIERVVSLAVENKKEF